MRLSKCQFRVISFFYARTNPSPRVYCAWCDWCIETLDRGVESRSLFVDSRLLRADEWADHLLLRNYRRWNHNRNTQLLHVQLVQQRIEASRLGVPGDHLDDASVCLRVRLLRRSLSTVSSLSYGVLDYTWLSPIVWLQSYEDRIDADWSLDWRKHTSLLSYVQHVIICVVNIIIIDSSLHSTERVGPNGFSHIGLCW